MTRTIVISITAIIIAALMLAGFWFYLGGFKTKNHAVSGASTYDTLMTSNGAFAKASAAYQSGDYSGAAALYRQALAVADNPTQEGQISIKLAQTLENAGDLNGAIDLYQSISQNQNFPSITRAYAVEDLGLLYDQFGNSVVQRTFSVPPFSDMVASSTSTSYKNLYQYSVNFFPLANAEVHIANYYATLLVRAKRGAITLDGSTIKLFNRLTAARLADADKDIARMQNDPNEAAGLPDVLKRVADVIGKRAEVGAVATSTAEVAYQKAMSEYAALGPGQDGFMRYFYAAYRSALKYPASDVQSILAPIYTSAVYHGTPAETFFTNEKHNVINQKTVLQRLASYDPNFKKYLMSLGWTESDFQ